METKKTFELTHKEICHALIKYIERDKNECITGTPTLYITSDGLGRVTQCTLDINDVQNYVSPPKTR
jgi:hypothetical protein